MPIKHPQTDRVGSNFVLSVVAIYLVLCLKSLSLMTLYIYNVIILNVCFLSFSKHPYLYKLDPWKQNYAHTNAYACFFCYMPLEPPHSSIIRT